MSYIGIFSSLSSIIIYQKVQVFFGIRGSPWKIRRMSFCYIPVTTRKIKLMNQFTIGAENLYRATTNCKVKETVALELNFVEASVDLLKEELIELNGSIKGKLMSFPTSLWSIIWNIYELRSPVFQDQLPPIIPAASAELPDWRKSELKIRKPYNLLITEFTAELKYVSSSSNLFIFRKLQKLMVNTFVAIIHFRISIYIWDNRYSNDLPRVERNWTSGFHLSYERFYTGTLLRRGV